MNDAMHRDYESNAPVKFYQYKDRVEIIGITLPYTLVMYLKKTN